MFTVWGFMIEQFLQFSRCRSFMGYRLLSKISLHDKNHWGIRVTSKEVASIFSTSPSPQCIFCSELSSESLPPINFFGAPSFDQEREI